VAQSGFELAPDLTGASEPEHGREADDLAGDDAAVELREHGFPEGGLLETPGKAERADVAGLPERRRDLYGPARDRSVAGPLRAGDVVREVGGKEILEPAEPNEDEASASAQVACGHGFGQKRRWLCGADRGRDEEVLVEAALVALIAEAGLEPVEARTDELDGELPVRVPGVRGGELGQRLRRALDRAACVAEHIDRRRGEVRRTEPFREDGHPLAGLGQA